MRAKWIVGKTVERVVQTVFYNEQIGKMDVDLEGIIFEDGTKLWFSVGETVAEYTVDAIAFKNGKPLK